MGLRSTIRGNYDQMNAGVRRRGFIAPTWGFVPTVRRRKNSLRLDKDLRPVDEMNFEIVRRGRRPRRPVPRPQTEPSSNLYYRRLLPPLNLVERSPSRNVLRSIMCGGRLTGRRGSEAATRQ